MSAAITNGKPEARPYISRLSISGFKSIRHVELELGRLNILIGSNGSGKSNLASVVRMLKAYADKTLTKFVARSGGANSILNNGPKHTTTVKIATVLSRPIPVTSVVVLEYAESDQLTIVSEWSEGISEARLEKSGWNESVLASETEWAAFSKLFRGFLAFHLNDTSPEARIRSTGDIDDNVQLQGDGRNLAAFLYKLQQVRPEQFQVLSRTIKLVAPFFDSFVLRPNELNRQTIMLRWREAGDGEEFGCHVLSDGTLRFIALAALLSQPKESLPSLIFLDEPEMGLHPAALTHLVGMIKTAAMHSQVIVATQSVEMLNHFEAEDVIVVERHEGATEFKRLDPAKLTDWLEDYSLGELWLKNIIGGRITR